jgi:hypothetical protein
MAMSRLTYILVFSSLGGPLSKLCVTPPFSINVRCQIENQVSDYRLLGASSLYPSWFWISSCIFLLPFLTNFFFFIRSELKYPTGIKREKSHNSYSMLFHLSNSYKFKWWIQWIILIFNRFLSCFTTKK